MSGTSAGPASGSSEWGGIHCFSKAAGLSLDVWSRRVTFCPPHASRSASTSSHRLASPPGMRSCETLCSVPIASTSVTSNTVVDGMARSTAGEVRRRACGGRSSWKERVAGAGAKMASRWSKLPSFMFQSRALGIHVSPPVTGTAHWVSGSWLVRIESVIAS